MILLYEMYKMVAFDDTGCDAILKVFCPNLVKVIQIIKM